MDNEKCGVYKIECRPNGRVYVGSSKRIYRRWSEHRAALRRNRHHCRHLQRAWNVYGESQFTFLILEECGHEELELREQFHVDQIRPQFNHVRDVKRHVSQELLDKWATLASCPHGHAYDKKNTYRSQRSKHICRACAAVRQNRNYASETLAEKDERNRRKRNRYYANHERYRAQQREYVLSHKEEKREYDRLHRKDANERRRRRHLTETVERHQERLRLKRESYHRCKI